MQRINDKFSNINCGNIKVSPFVVSGSGEIIDSDYEVKINEKSKRASLCKVYNNSFKDDIYFEFRDGEIICQRYFENISDNEIEIKELGFSVSGISFGEKSQDDYFYHNENPRCYMQMTFGIDHRPGKNTASDGEFEETAGNKWLDEGVIQGRIGASPYQPFPAILFSSYNTNTGLVHGTLSQKVFYHNYDFAHKENAISLVIYSSFKGLDKMCLEPGRVLVDEWYIGRTDKADDIERIFENYTNVLRKKLPVAYGRTDINRDNMVWGSWNDGVFRDVTDELVLREAEYLKENFPTVRWIQLDDGYSKFAVQNNVAHGLGMPYEGDEGVDKEKFPDGLRSFSDKIREIGLRPAIWIGGFCPNTTKIHTEHPEWFIDYSYRTKGRSNPIDVSVPEAREYMENAINILCRKYGFEAVKHDFWSYAFEDSNIVFRNKDKSGYEYRKWWLKSLRDAIPDDGYLQTGCDIVMGNPFLGEYFTNYRYGIDIADGNWENVKTNYLWGVACFSLHTGDLFVPNSDSVGMLPGLNDDEAYFCINYCLVTHSMVEIAGLLSKAEHNERYKMLKKAVCNPNNGQDIFFADYDYRKEGYNVPEIIYFKTPHFSRVENSEFMPIRTVGIFNLSEENKTYTLNTQMLGLDSEEYILTDVWSGESFNLVNTISFNVRPHASLLLAISRKEGIQLYDANIRINSVKADGQSLLLETDYAAKNVEISFSRKVKKISFTDKDISFTRRKNTVSFNIDEKSILKIDFEV